MQAPGADVLDPVVDLGGQVGDFGDGVVGELEGHVLHRHQGDVLLDQAGLGLGEDAHEVVPGQRLQLDPDGQPSLQLGQHVRGLAHVEGARRDEQDVVGLDGAPLGGHRGSLDQGQQVPLHALAADVAAEALGPHGDLVDLVDKDDAVVLHHVDGLLDHLVLVQQLVALLGDQHVMGLAHGHALRFHLRAEGLAHHLVQIDHAHLGAGHAGDIEGGQAATAVIGDLDLHLLVVEFPVAQHLAEFLPGVAARPIADQGVEHPFLGAELGLGRDLAAHALAALLDGHLQEVADDLLHVAPDVAHFGELGGLHLDERRLGQLRQAAADLGLADAGGADHQDVLGQDLLAQVVVQLQAPPAVPQRDGDGALGVLLADDEAVQLGDDLARGEAGHRDSMVTVLLV